jgi:hypothetical protein
MTYHERKLQHPVPSGASPVATREQCWVYRKESEKYQDEKVSNGMMFIKTTYVVGTRDENIQFVNMVRHRNWGPSKKTEVSRIYGRERRQLQALAQKIISFSTRRCSGSEFSFNNNPYRIPAHSYCRFSPIISLIWPYDPMKIKTVIAWRFTSTRYEVRISTTSKMLPGFHLFLSRQRTAEWYSNELRAGWSGGSCPGGDWEFFSSPPRPDRLWGPPSLLSNRYQGLLPWG